MSTCLIQNRQTRKWNDIYNSYEDVFFFLNSVFQSIVSDLSTKNYIVSLYNLLIYSDETIDIDIVNKSKTVMPILAGPLPKKIVSKYRRFNIIRFPRDSTSPPANSTRYYLLPAFLTRTSYVVLFIYFFI